MESTAKRIGISKKMLLVAASFSLPIGVLVYLVVANINEFINFAVWEVKGCAYQRPLEALLRDVSDHQRLTTHCPANADCSAKLNALKNGIEKEIQDLAEVDAKYGTDLEFTGAGLAKRGRQLATVQNLKSNWQGILSAMAGNHKAADADSKYDTMVATIQMMITHMGDTSKLILDPDLDTYYAMSNTLLVLPQTQDRLSRVIAAGRDAMQKGTLTLKERTDMAVFAALLQQSDQDMVNANFKTALNEDQNFYGTCDTFQKNVPPALKAYNDAASKFVAMTTQLSSPETSAVPLDEYIEAGVMARVASFKLEEISIDELENMLNMRIASYAARRMWALILAALALFVASVFAYKVTQSITEPLNKLARTLGPGATLLSGCVNQISEASKKGSSDATTTAIICDELNAHAEDMRKSVDQLESIVFGHASKANSPTASK